MNGLSASPVVHPDVAPFPSSARTVIEPARDGSPRPADGGGYDAGGRSDQHERGMGAAAPAYSLWSGAFSLVDVVDAFEATAVQ